MLLVCCMFRAPANDLQKFDDHEHICKNLRIDTILNVMSAVKLWDFFAQEKSLYAFTFRLQTENWSELCLMCFDVRYPPSSPFQSKSRYQHLLAIKFFTLLLNPKHTC